jgi:hypothetical protein
MQFDRVINLKVDLSNPPPSITYRGQLEISNLRIAFSVFKSESWSTNTANIRVWNLGESKRNELNSYGDGITLSAGYRQETGPEVLFRGNTSLVSHIWAEPEIISVFDCGDGEKTLNSILASWSFGANTPVRTVIEAYAGLLGLTIVEMTPTDNLVYALGHKYAGIAKDGLEKACKAVGLFPSVQNNNLVILKQGVGSGRPPVDVNPDTGMIGIPQRYTDRRQYLYRALPPNGAPKPGWKVRTLLRPDILPGDRIRLRSQRVDIDGIFYVISIRHEGDNFGPQFESLLEVIAV